MKLPEPICGQILVEFIVGDVRDYMLTKSGIDSEKSLIALPEEFLEKHATPIGKGKVMSLAPDAFGQVFRMRFGAEVIPPNVGDIVYFAKQAGTSIDPEGKYQFVTDNNLMGIDRQS